MVEDNLATQPLIENLASTPFQKWGSCSKYGMEVAAILSVGVTEESEDELLDAESGSPRRSTAAVDAIDTSTASVQTTGSSDAHPEIQDELRKADEEALRTSILIERMKKSIASYQSMDILSPDDERTLKARQKELLQKLRDFEHITKRVRSLVGMGDAVDGEDNMQPFSTECPEMNKFSAFISRAKQRPLQRTEGESRFDGENWAGREQIRVSDKETILDKMLLHSGGGRQPFETDASIANEMQRMKIVAFQVDCRLSGGRDCDPEEETYHTGMQNCEEHRNSCHKQHEPKNTECAEYEEQYREKECCENAPQPAAINQMECELQEMQQELAQVQKEREVLENQRRVLKNFAPDTCIPGKALREGWRNDQVMRLQEDLECKIMENQTLHAQVERLKAAIEATQRGMDDWETRACELEHKLRCLDSCKNKMAEGKVKQMELEQQIQLACNKVRESQDEIEELRALIDDQAGHLECYRNKYLLAQQQVEEQKRQIEQMEADQCRIGDQVQCEIQRIKNQFQERLQELSPLPDMLKSAQAKLQEAQQLRVIAENNCEDLSRDLQSACEKNAEYEGQICKLRNTQQQLLDERTSLRTHLETFEQKCNKMKEDICKYKQTVAQLEETACQTERSLEEKTLECARLRVEIETIRDDSARQLSRCRERFETMRRSLQSQVSDLEQELASSRACAATALRDRDEIQQKLQAQVTNITQSFGQTQDRIKNLQNVVDVLRSNVMNSEPGQIESTDKCCAAAAAAQDTCAE